MLAFEEPIVYERDPFKAIWTISNPDGLTITEVTLIDPQVDHYTVYLTIPTFTKLGGIVSKMSS